MSDSTDSPARFAEKIAALADLGFRPVRATPMTGESVPVSGNRYKVSCSQPSMGTLVSVTALDESSDLAQHAAGLAFQEMTRVVSLLNRYDSSSALSYLNTEGSIVGPPPELTAVLWQARNHHDVSEGAFDPTVQPLVDLFRNGAGGGRHPASRADLGPGSASRAPVPSEADIREAMALVDGSKVELDRELIRLTTPGMGLTLDGIAKGYVVDRIASVLSEQGLKSFLINAGGDIRSVGVRDDGRPWQVGVQDPKKQGELPDVIGLSNRAVATSGSYEVYFDRDRTYHHIVSARTGGSPQFSQSVSVVAPTALAADALATSVFVMEPKRGVAFIESFPECACLIVDQDGRQLRSRGWRSSSDPSTSKAGIP